MVRKRFKPKRVTSNCRVFLSWSWTFVVVVSASIGWKCQTAEAQPNCANPPVASITSSQVPADVCVSNGFAGNPIQFFDDYSWKSFVALIWPAQAGSRGKADVSKSVSDSGPRVFETYKNLSEMFHQDGSPPSPWNQFDPPAFNACAVQAKFGDLILASFSKFSDLGQAGFGTLIGPLVAQNTTYVRYMTGFNEIEFNQIVSGQWYLRSKLPSALTFAVGALDVKSAWIDMTNIQHPERYYTRPAWVLDPQTGSCSQRVVGLVGLHIVQKTTTRPQWIWSSFEQVDNVPSAQPGSPATFTFNDGHGTAMPASNPYPISPLIEPTPPPFNIERLKPIHSSTSSTNKIYQQLLHSQGSVWQFYQLVMTQWPVQPSSPALPGTPPNTFPGQGSDQTSFSNVTLETFEQSNIRTGCMNCHNQTMTATDFLWSLKDHAFPSTIPGLMMMDKSLRNLETLIKTVRPAQFNKIVKDNE